MAALHELASSFAASGEFEKSLAAATRGTEYDSPLLPLFYDRAASAYDLLGEPDKAIETYRNGIRLRPDSDLLYRNMALTYLNWVVPYAPMMGAHEWIASRRNRTHEPALWPRGDK
jgi:tetratricopeptide (TPR) repeat protein